MRPLSAKAQGDWAELVFLQEARRRGFQVARPLGDTAAYDVLLDNGRRIFRVQVKSSSTAMNGGYHVNAAAGLRGRRWYGEDEIDVLAAYIVPLDLWYMIPSGELRKCLSLGLFPRGFRGRLEEYCGAWRVFGEAKFRGRR